MQEGIIFFCWCCALPPASLSFFSCAARCVPPLLFLPRRLSFAVQCCAVLAAWGVGQLQGKAHATEQDRTGQDTALQGADQPASKLRATHTQAHTTTDGDGADRGDTAMHSALQLACKLAGPLCTRPARTRRCPTAVGPTGALLPRASGTDSLLSFLRALPSVALLFRRVS